MHWVVVNQEKTLVRRFSDQRATSQWIRAWVLEDCYPNFN